MLKVGLTGNIGSGKSLLASIFRILGIPVFSADQEAKALYRQADVKRHLLDVLGPEAFDKEGEADHKRMALLLFRDADLLKRVNGLVHPLVRESFQRFSLQNIRQPYILYEAAILVESGYYKELDRLIVVTAPEPIRLERVMRRDGITSGEVLDRARFQMDEKEKAGLADWVIENDGSHMVIPRVLEIDRQLREMSSC